jgi:hypothetical protein
MFRVRWGAYDGSEGHEESNPYICREDGILSLCICPAHFDRLCRKK